MDEEEEIPQIFVCHLLIRGRIMGILIRHGEENENYSSNDKYYCYELSYWIIFLFRTHVLMMKLTIASDYGIIIYTCYIYYASIVDTFCGQLNENMVNPSVGEI